MAEDWRSEHERMQRVLYAHEGREWEPAQPRWVYFVRAPEEPELLPCGACDRHYRFRSRLLDHIRIEHKGI